MLYVRSCKNINILSWSRNMNDGSCLLGAFSRTKNRTSSMYLVQAWSTSSRARETHLIVTVNEGTMYFTWRSERRAWSQYSSIITKARLWYLAFVLEQAPTVCFLNHQETQDWFQKRHKYQKLTINHLGSDAKLASQKAVMERVRGNDLVL